MKINYLSIALLAFLFSMSLQAQDLSEPGKLGVGLASSYPAYGLSAKYNFTENHAAQVIVGGASYGFGSSSFAMSGRYLYNFQEKGDSFIYRPYAYGQLGYFTVKYEFLGYSESFNTISFGVGGGVEFTIPNFVEGLAFNAELGYVGGSFDDGVGTYAGFAYGAGIHYYFNL
ncbi:hypothetical protein [Winogradskyella sp. SYSU M77433]|uniref:hypothetical protein n=1 Tax=Winogradskyella sp. SYSU M77433 TaxID=3042722 RepID=UPI002481676F|nr:hypothetical protein [Winogradskyella sp. SYSU M77433]MDH7914234.1 hypothetical protein [Winogradskyella sp. SYSU M77433]|tara:strand:- start:684 stop:1199 length:516 start_codon:yes stop_codon:yes gene_type:complete